MLSTDEVRDIYTTWAMQDPDPMNDELSTEAVEARDRLARAMYAAAPYHVPPPSSGVWDALYVAALPHLPQHVSPSVDQEALARVREFVPARSAMLDVSERIAFTPAESDHDGAVLTLSDLRSVLALLSSQPTVEQVRRETLLSAADDAHRQADTVVRIGTEARIALLQTEDWLRARAAEAGEQ